MGKIQTPLRYGPNLLVTGIHSAPSEVSLCECASHLFLLAASTLCSLSIVDLMERNLRQCGHLSPSTRGWYKAAGVVAFFGSPMSSFVTRYTTAALDYAADQCKYIIFCYYIMIN